MYKKNWVKMGGKVSVIKEQGVVSQTYYMHARYSQIKYARETKGLSVKQHYPANIESCVLANIMIYTSWFYFVLLLKTIMARNIKLLNFMVLQLEKLSHYHA